MKKTNNQFLILAFISILIIAGLFINPNPSGYSIKEETTTTWHCGFYNSPPQDVKGSWRWVSWPDTEIRLGKEIRAKDVNCVTGEWVCPYETCGDGKIVEDCYCIK